MAAEGKAKLRASVVVCTYNGASHLQEQLDSFASQLRLPDELIVCDDASKDSTPDLIRAFAAKAPFPVHLHINPQNLGLHQNFGKAIGLASGDVIFISDQDDVWRPEKISTLIEVFESPPIPGKPAPGLVFCDATVVDETLKLISESFWKRSEFTPSLRQALARDPFPAILRYNFVQGAAMALRADLREVILPFPRETIYDGWVALCAAGIAPIVPVDRPLQLYRLHASQAVGLDQMQFLNRAKIAKVLGGGVFTQQAAELKDLRQRLATRSEAQAREALPLIDDKLSFLEARQRLHERPRPLRVPTILKQLLAGRYHRYATGWKSVAKDTLM